MSGCVADTCTPVLDSQSTEKEFMMNCVAALPALVYRITLTWFLPLPVQKHCIAQGIP